MEKRNTDTNKAFERAKRTLIKSKMAEDKRNKIMVYLAGAFTENQTEARKIANCYRFDTYWKNLVVSNIWDLPADQIQKEEGDYLIAAIVLSAEGKIQMVKPYDGPKATYNAS